MSVDSEISLRIHPEAARMLEIRENDLTEFALSCIQEHSRILSSNGAVLKNAPESAVTIVELPGSPTVCVKQLRWRGFGHALKGFFRPTQGLRTYRNGWRLQDQGIRVAAPLVLARRKKYGLVKSEWVIMQVLAGALEMDRYLVKKNASQWTREEKIGVTRSFGRFMGSLHAKGMFHSDLKTCNILVSENCQGTADREMGEEHAGAAGNQTVRFSLLDYDEVRFMREVPHKKRVKNLVQLFLSVPVSVRAAQRLRFLSEYALHVGMGSKERRATALDVLAACRGKSILYVGFSGDVTENWE